jgi:myo-inositol 2-dehydrogenase/D-chiro-inositol 1-dehydrogenase
MGSDLARNAKWLETARVVAVSDVAEERARPLGEELGAKVFVNYDDMLSQPDVDAVIVASPPFMHRRMVEAAARAGKHVFCEKPMAPSVADCDAMIREIEKAGVKFQIGHVCRFHATHRKVRELVASGKYGSPTTILVHRIGGKWGSNHPNWRWQRSQSGGVLMEVNAHEIDFMRFVCGDVVAVSAVGGRFVDDQLDYPDVALVSMQFANGAVGVLHSSMASASGGYGGRVDLTEASILFPRIWGGKDDAIEIQPFIGDRERIPLAELRVETPVRAEIRAFVDAILNDTETAITARDGRAAVEVAESAYLSIERGGELIRLGSA